jgi:hypothetical protein
MGVQHAPRRAGRPAGEQQPGGVIGLDKTRESGRIVFDALPLRIGERYGVFDRRDVVGDVRESCEVARVADEHGRLRRRQLRGLLARAESLIDQCEDAPAAGHAVVQPRVCGAVVRDHRHAVATAGSILHPTGHRTDLPVELREGRGAPSGEMIALRSGTAAAAEDTSSWMRSIRAAVIPSRGYRPLSCSCYAVSRIGKPLFSARERSCFRANCRLRPALGIRIPAHTPCAPGVWHAS